VSADETLLREILLAVYRDVNPDISERADHLVRKLAAGAYARGCRIQIGANRPPQHRYIYQSSSPLGHLVWVCKDWCDVMGYRSRAAVGRHISDFIAPSSYQMVQNFAWPELVRVGRVDDVPLILVTATRDMMGAVLRSEILRDPRGSFERTFAKIKVTLVTAVLALLSSAAQSAI
jgi:hypothetical protein